jgi:hypothetical protein
MNLILKKNHFPDIMFDLAVEPLCILTDMYWRCMGDSIESPILSRTQKTLELLTFQDIRCMNNISDSEIDLWDNVEEESSMAVYWNWNNLTEPNKTARQSFYTLMYESILYSFKMFNVISKWK